MNSNTSLSLIVVAIAALVLLFASGPVIGKQQAVAYGYYHGHYGHYYHGHYYRHHAYYRGHGYIHVGKTVKTPRGIYHKGVTVRAY
jgi:hypothetical protein